MKNKEYIIKICIDAYMLYGESDKDIIDKENATYHIKEKFKVLSIEHIVSQLPIYNIHIEQTFGDGYTLECNSLDSEYEDKNIEYYLTYERAFLENFMNNKQYLLFPNGYSGIFREYYDNGLIRYEYFHNNGIINGIYKTFFELNTIQIHILCNYVNGKKCGEYTKYYQNGFINIHSYYDCDKLYGEYKVFNKNNILTYLANYNDDKLISYNIFYQ